MVKLIARSGKKEHKVVSEKEWLTARKRFLVKEKKFTRLRDQLNVERRKLPWAKVEKEYVFEGPDGKESLGDLFGRKRQLIVQHFMFGPGWGEGCPHCSFWADHWDAALVHLAARDTALVVVSRAPFKEIKPFKKRMGWRFKWVSSFGSEFNFDYHVSFTPEEIRSGKLFYNYRITRMKIDEREGFSVFYKDPNGDVFHTYSTYERGLDLMNTAYNLLDLTAKGRDEDPEHTQDWVRYHDRYQRKG
ncbi:MAG: DUF899 domain-containing protein [Verrucomicrobia bacterium]|nr:MAG: DUF899 domain-containing protein [Verrucomicrobiota bacterium]